MDLDTEKMGLNQTLELSEMTRQQLEEEIQALNREKGDIQEQLSSVSRQKQALAEELLQLAGKWRDKTKTMSRSPRRRRC